MKMTITLTEKEVNHLYPDHDFYDCCGEVESIMVKIQQEIRKRKDKK